MIFIGMSLPFRTYVSSLISPILTSQIFRKQFWGALSELYHTTLWEMLYLKMSRFVSLLYKQEFFYYFMWMSPWRSGSMQVSHTEGPWFQSRSSSFLKIFFFRNIFFSTFHIKISVQNVFYMNLKEKTRDLCRKKILQKKKKWIWSGLEPGTFGVWDLHATTAPRWHSHKVVKNFLLIN